MSLFKGKDTSFLSMEVDSFAHPGFECVRDFFHRVDHSGKLGVQSVGKQPSYFRCITCLELFSQVLKFREVCLEAVILSSGSLSQIIELISGCFFKMIGVEHVFKSLLYGLPVFVCCLDFRISEFLQPDFHKVFSTSLVHFI